MALVRASDPQTSSVSSTCRYCRYHVFLSFRGQDTRKTFTDHLYTALVNAGFRTFRDDDEVERGEAIKPELQKAIKHSRTSVIVFSKNYASSRWCLDELVMILERLSADHVVLPVFYDVDPSDVRNQTGSLAKAFARHQKTQPSNRVKEWRKALAEVADLAGMVLQNQADGHESKFINKIVQVIGEKLRRRPLSVPHIMIGMHSRIHELNLWLQDGSDDVGILVIYGMSGIGKTTIAKSLYNTNFKRFDGSSFLENIREISQLPNGLVQIQIHLLSDILYGRKVKIQSVSKGMAEIEDAISSKKVFLVLDDVDHISQLDVVLRMKDQFYPGSKIIITTRRAGLLKAHQVTKVHAVETLTQEESLELFSWHAFGQDHPIKDYIEYSEKLVDHCKGLPLALQVLGSSLLGESIDVWKSALEKLKVIPNGEIVNKLRVSYDSLQDDHDRKLFLHIACFFIGKDKDYIAKILDGCDFYTIVGIQNLIDRCLVIINGWDKVQMHNLIRGMGREIVRRESNEPWKRSRVWHHKDSFKILTEKNGTETIEGLVLNMHMCPAINSNEQALETNAFSRMRALKLLHLSHVQLNGSYAEFCTGLIWLCWTKFPLDSIPVDFPLESVIILEMQYSGLRQVFKGTKYLPSLKTLDLSHSHSLTETIDFSYCPNLEKLVLVDCTSLIYVHGSIGNLERLIYLNMKDCKNLRMLPKNICMLKSLETFIISGCSNLNGLSIEMLRNMDSLKVLETDGIPISELWLERSSSILGSLPCSLVELSLWGCNLSDDAFPMDFSHLSSLQRLNLGNNPIGCLPNCIKGLTRLHELSFFECTSLKSLLGLPKLNKLDIADCISLEKITYQYPGLAWQGCTRSRRNYNLVEWEYRYKLQPIGRVDVEMINLLGLCNLLESMAPIRMYTAHGNLQEDDPIPVQGLYERGMFSTFFGGNEVPGQFSHKSRGSSISFTVPLLDNHRTRGLIVFVVYVNAGYDSPIAHHSYLSHMTVKNKSKGLKGVYYPSHYGIPGEGEDMIWLSHWKLDDQLQGGDEVVVSVIMKSGLMVKELGIRLVQVQQEENHNMMSISTDSSYDDRIWHNKRLGDSDEEDKRGKLKQPSLKQSEIRQLDRVRLRVPAAERVYPRFLFTDNLVRAGLINPAKMTDSRKVAEAKKMNESSRKRLMMGLEGKKKKRQPEASSVRQAAVDPEDQTLAELLRQLGAEPASGRVADEVSAPRQTGTEAVASKAAGKRPVTVDLEASPASKRCRQLEASRAVVAVEDEEGPTEAVTIVCPSKTVQFVNHMILDSQMELPEIDELPKRLLREETGRAFRLQASASMDMWLCVKRAIAAAERAKKAYEDGRAKVAEAGKALQDHAHLLKEKEAAERQAVASEAKVKEMKGLLKAALAAARDAEAAKEAVQVALEESERAKAAEIEGAVRSAIRGYRSTEEFTVLLDKEVSSEMTDLLYRFKRYNPGQKLNLNFIADPPPLPEGITEEMIEEYEGEDAAEGFGPAKAAARDEA